MSSLLPLLVSVVALLAAVPVHSTKLDGMTWSSSGVLIPNTATRWAPNCGPAAFIFDAQLIISFKPLNSDQVSYISFIYAGDAQPQRTWQTFTVPNAFSPTEAVLVNLPIQDSMIAFWATEQGTVSYAIWDTDFNPPQWDQYTTSDIPVPTDIRMTPWSDTADPQMNVYHLVPGTNTIANFTTDGYTLWGDVVSAITNACTSGATLMNNVDLYMTLYYPGCNPDGTPDGYIWMTHYDQNAPNTMYTAPVNTGHTIDAGSTISAIQWNNASIVYDMVVYKCAGEIVYMMFLPTDYHTGILYPDTYHTGLFISGNPSAVSYSDPYIDNPVIMLFYSEIDPSTGEYAIWNAMGQQYFPPPE